MYSIILYLSGHVAPHNVHSVCLPIDHTPVRTLVNSLAKSVLHRLILFRDIPI